jgi:hypothetical protein
MTKKNLELVKLLTEYNAKDLPKVYQKNYARDLRRALVYLEN